MSLVRTGVVLAGAIALMPSDPKQQEALYAKATELAGDVMTYCDRNGDQCQQARQAFEALQEKAAFAAALAVDLMARHGQLSEEDNRRVVDRGTLTKADLEPAWRGSQPRR